MVEEVTVSAFAAVMSGITVAHFSEKSQVAVF